MFKMGTLNQEYGATTWDDRGRTGIAQIFISHGERIHSLQFQFVENGTLVLSDKYGRDGYPGTPKFHAVSALELIYFYLATRDR